MQLNARSVRLVHHRDRKAMAIGIKIEYAAV